MSRPNIHSKTSPTIKQFGQFHLKCHDVYRGGRKIPTNTYMVALDNGDGSYEELRLINSDKNTLSDLLDHLHGWLHGRYNDINQIKQVQNRARNDEAKAGYQEGLDAWELEYLHVGRAIRELELDYQPDESIYNNLQDSSSDNNGTCSFS